MSLNRRTLPHALTVIAIMLCTLTSASCAGPGPAEGVLREIRWHEQVRFSNGEVVIVERARRYRPGGELHTEGGVFKEGWIEASLPKLGKTRWQGSLSPLVLDVAKSGEWYMLGAVVTARGQSDYQLKDYHYYVSFKLVNRNWVRVPFTEFPEGFQPNLLANVEQLFSDEKAPSGTLVTFETKERLDSVPTLGKAYRRIDRRLGL